MSRRPEIATATSGSQWQPLTLPGLGDGLHPERLIKRHREFD